MNVRSELVLRTLDVAATDLVAYYRIITQIGGGCSYYIRQIMGNIMDLGPRLPIDCRVLGTGIVEWKTAEALWTIWRDAKKGIFFFSWKPEELIVLHRAIAMIFWKGLPKELGHKYRVKVNKTWTMSFTALYALSAAMLAGVPGGPEMILDMQQDGELS